MPYTEQRPVNPGAVPIFEKKEHAMSKPQAIRAHTTLSHVQLWLYTAWFQLLIRYRKTLLGPLWILVGPALFISFLGLLYAQVGGVPKAVFIPHLTIGLITWTLITGFVTTSPTVFQRAKAQILQSGMSLIDIVMGSVFSTVIQFMHQIVLILAIFIIFHKSVSLYALVSLIGLGILILNGVWLTVFFGILGARYRDLTEIVQAIMRIAFLATPIIWMPGSGGRGGVMGAFLVFNPFYHFLELIRAPLMGEQIAPLSWAVVLSITVIGFALAYFIHRRFAKNIPLWV